MPTLDGGHYFLSTLIPLRLEPVQNGDGGFTSPSHVLRETLASLPTAQQSPACVAAGFSSPFSRCTRTHFARLVVIDQPMYNGRDGGDAVVEALRTVDLLAHQPVDQLSRPYLMFTADFDARPQEADGGLQSWADGLWQKMEAEVRAIFAPCLGFEAVNDGAAFAAWLRRCQLETTMSYNDYYLPGVGLPGYTLQQVVVAAVVATLALSALAALGLAATGGRFAWLWAIVPAALLVSALAAVGFLWIVGHRPFPTGPGSDLPSVLKSLHVQQRFALLAAELQGADDATVHARFGAFLDELRPQDLAAPTQPPGVIRSDGVALVTHARVVAPAPGAAAQ